MSDSLAGQRVGGTFRRILQIAPAGADTVTRPIRDGEGEALPLALSNTAVEVTVDPSTDLGVVNKRFMEERTGAAVIAGEEAAFSAQAAAASAAEAATAGASAGASAGVTAVAPFVAEAQAAADTTTDTVAGAAVQRETLAALVTAMADSATGALGVVYGLDADEGEYRKQADGSLLFVAPTRRVQSATYAPQYEAVDAPLAFALTVLDGGNVERIALAVRGSDGAVEMGAADVGSIDLQEGRLGGLTLITADDYQSVDEIGDGLVPIVDADNRILGYALGEPPEPPTPTPDPVDPAVAQPSQALLPVTAGTVLSARGGALVECVNVSPFAIAAAFPGNSKSVRAIINRPTLTASTTISAAPGRGLAIPDAPDVLHIHGGMGQSLATGWTEVAGTSVLNTTAQPVPTDAFMFGLTATTGDVRMGLTVLANATIPELDPADLTGLMPLAATRGFDAPAGQTPLEGCTAFLSQEARGQAGISFQSLSFVSAQGGASITALQQGTQVYDNFLIAVARAQVLAAARGQSVIVDFVYWKHGESGQTDAGYQAALAQLQADIDADVKLITGQSATVQLIVSQPSSFSRQAPWAPPFATFGQLQLHNANASVHMAGPDYPFWQQYVTPETGNPAGIGWVHLANPGSWMAGEVAGRAARDALWRPSAKSRIVQMLTASRTGNTVTVTMSVPAPPLVFDTTLFPSRLARGFTYFDSGTTFTGGVISAAIPITSVVITNDGTATGTATLTITLGATPSGTSELLGYAILARNDTLTPPVAGGNVRDSAADVSLYDGRPLHNWACHQALSVSVF